MSLLTNMIYLLLRTAHHFCQNLVQTVRRIQMQTVHSEKGKEREECKHMGEKMKEEGKKLPKKKEKKHPTDPCNERVLRTCGIGRCYAWLMRGLMVLDTIQWSRDIYIEHITGHRQYQEV
ncbi:unnamed protein product [Lepidochelys olivacea]